MLLLFLLMPLRIGIMGRRNPETRFAAKRLACRAGSA
jgi:hypothetical protein